MTSVDAQVEEQQYFINVKKNILTHSKCLSSESVFKMVFLFSDLLSIHEYQSLKDSVLNGESIISLVESVKRNKNLNTACTVNLWAELLFFTKNYRQLKYINVCKHRMKLYTLNGGTFYSSDFQRLLCALADELTDEDVRYIWMHSLNGMQPFPEQPEILFHQMLFQKMMTKSDMLKELLMHFKVLGNSDLSLKVEQYLAKLEGRKSLTRIEYDLSTSTPGSYSGLALIFNNHSFKKNPNFSVKAKPLKELSDRNGTGKDADELDKLWKSFGIDTKPFLDCRSDEFEKRILEVLTTDLSFVKIFIVNILTHGEDGFVYGSDRVRCRIADIEAILGRCQKLAGIPKLLFIQACQGHAVQAKASSGLLARRYELDAPHGAPENAMQQPQYSDMLIGLATVPGFMSIRNIKEGSNFIQTVIEVLKTSGTTEDISLLIPEINNKVTQKWADYKYNNESLSLVQMPTFHNQLRKGLRFNRINGVNKC